MAGGSEIIDHAFCIQPSFMESFIHEILNVTCKFLSFDYSLSTFSEL